MSETPSIPHELLAPAGNWDCARAAIVAGANAIYFGLPRFNARMRADNFRDDDLEELMEFLHEHGARGYVTMNTLVFSRELQAAEDQIRHLVAAGVDALIVQDLGLAMLAAQVAPGLALHASTQMTLTSPEGLAFVSGLFPLDRAILARELSVKEIGRFAPSPVPLEVFVHGALCVAYSGQCLTSESLGQRSANRGECAQACRMPYELVVDGQTRDLGEVRYLLSPQDLAAVDMIPELVAAGVRSFKIEGRLKSPEYVTAVTRVYRKALDAALAGAASPVTPADRYALEMTFSRGLTTGWLAGPNHPYLTHGRFGKKRGPRVGAIADCGPGWIELAGPPDVPLAAGDGVVFDAGENRDLEQGARIWKIERGRLIFHRTYSGINWDRIRPGQVLFKTSDPKLETELRKFWQTRQAPLRKQPLQLVVSGQAGEPLVLTANYPGLLSPQSAASSIPLEPATQHPLDRETLLHHFGRLGGTIYQIDSLTVNLTGPCHLPVSQLNQVRRDLVTQLDAATVLPDRRASTPTLTSFRDLLPPVPAPPDTPQQQPELYVLCRQPDQAYAALTCGIAAIYCDFEDPRRYAPTVAACRQSHPGAKILLATPRILKPGESGYLRLIERAKPDGLLIRNLGALNYYKHRGDLQQVGDFSLNVANPLTARILLENSGLERLTISYDLNAGQALDLLERAPADWFELTLHQHMPLFHMEHCVFCAFLSDGKDHKDCGRPCETHVVHLRDRVGQLQRLHADVGCRNTLFNGVAQTGARFVEALRAAGLRRFRLELLDEDADATRQLIESYQDLLSGRADANEVIERVHALSKLGVTAGTLKER